jgi:hypothetical protein
MAFLQNIYRGKHTYMWSEIFMADKIKNAVLCFKTASNFGRGYHFGVTYRPYFQEISTHYFKHAEN